MTKHISGYLNLLLQFLIQKSFKKYTLLYSTIYIIPDFLKFGGLKIKLLENGHFNEVPLYPGRDTPE